MCHEHKITYPNLWVMGKTMETFLSQGALMTCFALSGTIGSKASGKSELNLLPQEPLSCQFCLTMFFFPGESNV